ncbi:hypothetical protein ACFLYM_00190 [Chloroflexota bacterium]
MAGGEVQIFSDFFHFRVNNTVSPYVTGYSLRCVSRPFDLESGRLTINEYGEFSVFSGSEPSWRHSEFRDYDKNFYSISVLSEGLTDAKYVYMEYKLDEDPQYTRIEEVFNRSPYQTIFLPSLTGKYLKLKFTLTNPSDTYMIVYILNGKIRSLKRKEMKFVVHISSGLALPNGGVYRCNVDNYSKALREINETRWPVTLKTFDGQEFEITFENMRERLISDPSHKQREYTFDI